MQPLYFQKPNLVILLKCATQQKFHRKSTAGSPKMYFALCIGEILLLVHCTFYLQFLFCRMFRYFCPPSKLKIEGQRIMMTEPKRYLITSALPYANGPKHIGHLAGAYLPADIYVRYLRAKKKDVVYVCGSDEHGAAITIQAMKEGTTPRAIVDKYHAMLQSNMADLGISFDIYHRTSAQIHHETTQEFFSVLEKNGDLEVRESEQYYDAATR
jgi:hypothetical protein